MLGGRVAEEIVFGDVSTGAQDDLRRATDLARQMVTRYGMSQTLGLATIEGSRLPLFLNTDATQTVECSEETSRMIDHEVRQLLEEARERVRGDLTAKRPTLEALAALLIEHEVIDRTALDQLLADDDVAGRRTSPITEAPVAT
jgi:cell division protease FtsH